jgi:RNA recognition motif-containing protein
MNLPPSNFSNNSLFIGDLSKFCTEANLESLFAPFGQIVDVKIKRNNTTGKTLSYGFVSFVSDACATTAMERLNGFPFHGRNLR